MYRILKRIQNLLHKGTARGCSSLVALTTACARSVPSVPSLTVIRGADPGNDLLTRAPPCRTGPQGATNPQVPAKEPASRPAAVATAEEENQSAAVIRDAAFSHGCRSSERHQEQRHWQRTDPDYSKRHTKRGGIDHSRGGRTQEPRGPGSDPPLADGSVVETRHTRVTSRLQLLLLLGKPMVVIM